MASITTLPFIHSYTSIHPYIHTVPKPNNLQSPIVTQNEGRNQSIIILLINGTGTGIRHFSPPCAPLPRRLLHLPPSPKTQPRPQIPPIQRQPQPLHRPQRNPRQNKSNKELPQTKSPPPPRSTRRRRGSLSRFRKSETCSAEREIEKGI